MKGRCTESARPLPRLVNVVAAVLAAGASRRLGQPKQLVRFRGEPLILRAITATRIAEIAETAVVLGAHADLIDPLLDPGVVRLQNAGWSEGIASSIRTAASWATERRAEALAVLLVDQPFVGASQIARLVDAWRRGAIAAASAYEGALGAPAVFDARMFADLANLRGDHGAAHLLRDRAGVAEVPFCHASFDVDTPADLQKP